MKQLKTTTFMSADDGAFLAWPLHSPSLPQYGDWCWITFENKRIKFMRSLTESEINSICSGYMVWGMKYANEPWAIVSGTEGGSEYFVSQASGDSVRSIGV